MATVFSVKEVAEGRLPAPYAQEQAAELLMSRLGSLAVRHGGINMLVYGSAARVDQTTNLRSDIDALVVMDDDLVASRLVCVPDELRHIGLQTHVPLDVHVLSRSAIRASACPLTNDALFVEHLKHEQRNSRFKIGDPTQGLVSLTDYREGDQLRVAAWVTHGYLIHKTEKFTSAKRSAEVDVRSFQRGLELSASLARKFGRIWQLAGYIEGNATDLMARSAAIQCLQSFTRSAGGWAGVAELMRYNAEYDDVLGQAQSHVISPEEYEAWLVTTQEAIYDQSLRVLATARLMLEREFLLSATPVAGKLKRAS